VTSRERTARYARPGHVRSRTRECSPCRRRILRPACRSHERRPTHLDDPSRQCQARDGGDCRVVAIAVEVVQRDHGQPAGSGQVGLAAAGWAGKEDDARHGPQVCQTAHGVSRSGRKCDTDRYTYGARPTGKW
jgi:hypothetical protein